MNRHCDTVMRTAGPRYRASGNRTQRLQGGEVLNDQDVAPKTMGIIVVVSPLWFDAFRVNVPLELDTQIKSTRSL